jgi:UDP-N-acetylglucosamine acyltransferase
LRRRGFSADALAAIKRAYKTLYKSGLTLDQAKAQLAEQARTSAEIRLLADFLQGSTRGIVR